MNARQTTIEEIHFKVGAQLEASKYCFQGKCISHVILKEENSVIPELEEGHFQRTRSNMYPNK